MLRDREALIDIVEAIKLILRYVEAVDFAKLAANVEKQDAILRRITIIGEATKRLSKDFRDQHPTIPWKEIAGMRDVITQEVRRHISSGSSIEEARNLLRLNGFKCGYHKTSEPVDTVETSRTSQDGDHLFCYLKISRLIYAETYQPSIQYKDGRVTDVNAYVGG